MMLWSNDMHMQIFTLHVIFVFSHFFFLNRHCFRSGVNECFSAKDSQSKLVSLKIMVAWGGGESRKLQQIKPLKS